MVRAAVSEGAAIGRLARVLMKGSKLVPDSCCACLPTEFARPYAAARILPGRIFRVRLAQALSLDNAVDGQKLDHVLELRIEQHVLNRILGELIDASLSVGY